MFCRNCAYSLRGLPTGQCPECGAAFDPVNPKTWLPTPYPGRIRWLERIAIAASSFPTLFVLGVHVQLVLARVLLGRWPHRGGMDDPKCIDGIGWLHTLNNLLTVAIIPGTLLTLILLTSLAARRAWTSFYLSGAGLALFWVFAIVLARWDPALALAWWFD